MFCDSAPDLPAGTSALVFVLANHVHDLITAEAH
jgi:hypothetical protein